MKGFKKLWIAFSALIATTSNTGSGNGLTVETDPNGMGSMKPIE